MVKLFTCLFGVFVFFLSHLVSQTTCEPTLRTIIVVHRHGDRSPLRTFPTDPYKNGSFYPQGFGRLTSAGKQRMYDVGRYLRRQYEHFLSIDRDVHEIYVRSTSVERCLESVQLLVNGAYKPLPESVWAWNRSELWIPVPVQTVEYTHDLMLNLFAQCTARKKQYDKVYAGQTIAELNKRFAPLYGNLSIWTGQPNFKDFQDGDYIYDAFLHQKMLVPNFTYPEWASETVLKELKEMKLTKFRVFSLEEEMQRLTMGVFLDEIRQKISKALLPSPKKIQYEDKDDLGDVKKMYIYSTHDIFLFNLLADLSIANDDVPPFGAAVIFELFTEQAKKLNYEQSLNSSFVRLWYLNETLSENYLDFKANPLRMSRFPADHDGNYTVREFFASFSHLLLSEADAIPGCQAPSETSPSASSSGTYITVIVIESIVIALFVGLFIKRRLR